MLILILIWAVSSFPNEKEPVEISFLPHWQPQAQFPGYYIALEKGFYKDNGLKVTIIPGGPTQPTIDNLKSGRADFISTFLTTGIESRASGLNLVNIVQLSQCSALMIVAKKASGIQVPQDLDGKKIGMWRAEFQLLPKAFIKQYDLNMEIVTIQNTMNLFLSGGIDAATAMWYNKYHTLINFGLDPDEMTTFHFYDYCDLNFPEDGIYCLEELYCQKPELCRAFADSSIEGWLYSFEHQAEAVEIVMKFMTQAHIPANSAHQKWMLARMIDLFMPDSSGAELGHLEKNTYLKVADRLIECGLIETIPPYEQFYKGRASYVKE